MHKILLLGAGKSATLLIDYLISNAEKENWIVTIVDADIHLVKMKTGNSPHAVAASFDIHNGEELYRQVSAADIVISMLPPTLHLIAARACLACGRHMLTASYVDEHFRAMQTSLEEKGILFLCEMGLDPGIDHMSAMRIIDTIKDKGGRIDSFYSHCGGLVAPEDDDNPWHYKISWNPRNIIRAGSAGALYKEQGQIIRKDYPAIFHECKTLAVEGLPLMAWYPNRDSLEYIPLYGVDEARTFVRTTLRYESFCRGWDLIVRAGLTDEKIAVDTRHLTYRQWSAPLLPFIDDSNRKQFEFLDLFTDTPVPASAKTAADILQELVERKLQLKKGDKDMIVMVHEFTYALGEKKYGVSSTLVVKGEDSIKTAMAKTVGLPLGIAAKLILRGTIRKSGLYIPVDKEIYGPVLEELELHGITFRETTSPIP
ncbi:MAG: saccharopine dehydrogenase [Terrimonas sp.]|nr:saccharopine dehydrogenase [Terrimonas sp.]